MVGDAPRQPKTFVEQTPETASVLNLTCISSSVDVCETPMALSGGRYGHGK